MRRPFGEVTYVIEERSGPSGDKLVVREAGSPALLVATAVLIAGAIVLVLADAHVF